ncbi:hypothetical protein AVEN_267266-1 [Araneus ventricosus]|uniref:Uncharacterized protein n=1 Tax=Araneus ventricosus TaxID=182803 RepID=A0A4Y2V5D7_ARAVE|nr:hypothetical protein AVEN_267266-1 [Araneus ventricosus]
MANERQCHLLRPLFGGNLPITLMTVISAWYHQLLEASPRKRIEHLNTLTYHLLYEKDLDGSHNSPQASTSACGVSKHDDDFSCFDEIFSPHKITSVEVNNLVRDLDLYKSKAEISASRLQKLNLLEENVRVTSFRTRHLLFESFFRKEESLVYCCDIDGLLKELRIAHEPNEWWLLIDASKLSLKAVLLNNGNELPSIPVAHAVCMKETYHNLKHFIQQHASHTYSS